MALSKDGDKQRLNCNVTKAQYAAVQKAAAKIGCSASTVVRMALVAWIQSHADYVAHEQADDE